MPGKDWTRWQEVEGDHADDPAYGRVMPTTHEGSYHDSDEDNDPNATKGAIDAAAELGVDLSQIQGTGAGGRITKSDVEDAASE